MKKYLKLKVLLSLLIVLIFSSILNAGEKKLRFTWEQQIPPDFSGWRLYISETSGVYTYQPATIFIGYTCDMVCTADYTINSPNGEQHIYYFVLTAIDLAGNESVRSGEVSQIIDFEAPASPTNLTVEVVVP